VKEGSAFASILGSDSFGSFDLSPGFIIKLGLLALGLELKAGEALDEFSLGSA